MVTNDADFVKSSLLAAVPFARTLGLEFVELSESRAVMRLPDNPDHHNHIHGPHAGAMFTLAEMASGAVVFNALGDRLKLALPLVVRAEIDYRAVAKGTVLAEAGLGEEWQRAVAELDGGKRPEFPVRVEVRTEDGTVTSALTVVWTLRPYR